MKIEVQVLDQIACTVEITVTPSHKGIEQVINDYFTDSWGGGFADDVRGVMDVTIKDLSKPKAKKATTTTKPRRSTAKRKTSARRRVR